MDQYHDRFPVYDDISSAGNHFFAPAEFSDKPDQPFPNNAIKTRGDYTVNPHSGATAIRSEFSNTTGLTFGGFIYQNGILTGDKTSPDLNFGTVPNAGIDLTGATKLTFWARGDQGSEKIDFFFGGVGWDINAPYKDSSPAIDLGTTTLTNSWQQYTINLAGADLHYVLGGFGWGANAQNNPNGAVFYLDDIQFELSASALQQRLNQPRFLQSYTTRPNQPDPFNSNKDDDIDFVLRNTAFSYDNAVAMLAFLADGSPDSIRRAKLIGDAFVYASNHDKTYTDGRIRTDYSAGDIALPPGWTPKNLSGTVPIAGFYVDQPDNKRGFYEVEQSAVDTGNNAWVMVSLMALFRRTSQESYLDEARRIGDFILTQKDNNNTHLYPGFLGGIINPESDQPEQRVYASLEHNEDIYAAFTVMYAITGDAKWSDGALFATQFIDKMWSDQESIYLAGTNDPNTRNTKPNQLPLDVQAWSILSLLTVHPGLLQGIETHFRTTEGPFSGYDFNNDKDGVWLEGTGQMAVAYGFANPLQAEPLRQTLVQIQATAPVSGAMRAALHDGLSTGFVTPTGDDFKYFDRPHISATSWNIFAQLNVDPYFIAGPGHLVFPGEYAISTPGTSVTLGSITQNGNQVTLVNGPNTATYSVGTNSDQLLDGSTVVATYANSSLTFGAGQVWTKLDLPSNFTNQAGARVHIFQNGYTLTFSDRNGKLSPGTWINPTQLSAYGEIVTIGSGQFTGQLLWDDGFVWSEVVKITGTNNGSGTTIIEAVPSKVLVTDYLTEKGFTVHTVQTGTTNIVFIDRIGSMVLGTYSNSNTNVSQATAPNYPGYTASIVGNTITWTDGNPNDTGVWTKTTAPATTITVTDYTNQNGVPVHVILNGTNYFVIVDALGNTSLGHFLTPTTGIADRYPTDAATFSGNKVIWQDGVFVWTQTSNPPLLITFTDANNSISHVQLLTPTTLVGLDGPLKGVTGTRLNGKILWSNGQVWDNFDFNDLNALFEMGTGYP